MKEFSIEQKAKAYDNLIKRLKDFQSEYRFETIDKYFPELKECKESDDEKIRKSIIEFVNQNKSFHYLLGVSKEDAIAWLEKQGEQKPWSEENEKKLSDIIKDLVHPWNEYIPDRIEDEIKWLKNKLKSIRTQSAWSPSDAQMESIKQAVLNMKDSACYDSVLVHLYEDLKKLKG